MTLHATCIAIGGAGVLLRGPSGAGKSDLALRLIDAGAALVSDDRVIVATEGGVALASPPGTLAGLLEVRGAGILRLPHVARCPLRLVVDLVPRGDVERMPEPQGTIIAGVTLPLVSLHAFDVSAAAKVRMALAVVMGQIVRND